MKMVVWVATRSFSSQRIVTSPLTVRVPAMLSSLQWTLSLRSVLPVQERSPWFGSERTALGMVMRGIGAPTSKEGAGPTLGSP